MFRADDSPRRTVLALVALVAGAAVPIQLITLSFGYAQYVQGIARGPQLLPTAHAFAAPYFFVAYVPALLVLAAIAWHARRAYPDLYRRIAVGFAAGFVSTVALDAARQAGVIHGWLPGDTPVMFGRMLTGSDTFAWFYPVGLLVHYINGADFGVFFTFVWGRRRTAAATVGWAVAWLLLVELGMMTLPPMGPMVGLFGARFAWPQLFLVTLVAHVLFGIMLGYLVHRHLTEGEAHGLYDRLSGGARR